MMRFKKLLSCMSCLILGVTAGLGANCATSLLHEIDSLLCKRGIAINAPGIYLIDNKAFTVEGFEDSIVTDIKLNIFSHEVKLACNPAICSFVERYLLYMYLLQPSSRQRIASDDNVIFKPRFSLGVDTTCDMSLSFKNNRYSLEWNKAGKQVFSMSFPNQYELISGMNKIESGDMFLQQVIDAQKLSICDDFIEPSIDELSIINDSSLYIKRGGYYLIKDVNSDCYYYRLSNGEISPVNSSLYPAETVSNLFASIVKGDYYLQVTQHLYSNKSKQFTLSVEDFIHYCRAMDCNIYVGIEQFDGKQLKATIVAENILLGFNHLLSIKLDRSILARKQGEIETDLFAFIPTHNLKSLFSLDELYPE